MPTSRARAAGPGPPARRGILHLVSHPQLPCEVPFSIQGQGHLGTAGKLALETLGGIWPCPCKHAHVLPALPTAHHGWGLYRISQALCGPLSPLWQDGLLGTHVTGSAEDCVI